MSNIESYLRETELFADFPSKTIQPLAAICRIKRINKKEVLFTEGDLGSAVYYCIDGHIQLYKSDDEGRQTVIKVIQSGELFGEVILFERDNYPVTARALGQSDLLVIPKSGFYSLLDDIQFRNQFIGVLIKKQRYLVEKIRSLTAIDIEERIYYFFKEQFGEKLDFKPQLSKKDVAAAIGTVPETLSRILLRLKSEGKLIWDFNRIHIDPNWKGK
jgi:CRP/FNR family transcriptional regulator